MRQVRTVKRHENLALFVNVEIDRSGVYPFEIPRNSEQNPTLDANGNKRPGLRRINESTRALLEAYDRYFAGQDDLDIKLWVRMHNVFISP
jgi:hypothetical protein